MRLRDRARQSCERSLASDDGLALLVALVVMFLIFLITTALLANAYHNVVGSARQRERLTAINAAEAGLAWYAQMLASADASTLTNASAWPQKVVNTYTSLAKQVPGIPGPGGFRVSVTYYQDAALLVPIPVLTNTTMTDPFYAVAIAKGYSNRKQSCQSPPCENAVVRSVRAVLELRPSKTTLGGTLGAMVLCKLGRNLTIAGSPPDSDVYLLASTANLASSNCGGAVPSNVFEVGSGQLDTTGNVYVPNGGVAISNATLREDLAALGAIALGQGGQPQKAKKACTVSKNEPGVTVCGDVTSGVSITTSGNVNILGVQKVCPSATCPIPLPSFPVYDQTAVTSAFSLAAGWAQNAGLPNLSNPVQPASKRVYVVSSPCPVVIDKQTMYLHSDTAIISPCGFRFTNKNDFLIARDNVFLKYPSTTPTLYFVTWAPANYAINTSCAVDTNYDTAATSGNFQATAVNMFIYTPCTFYSKTQFNLRGRILARTMRFEGNAQLTATSSQLGSPLNGSVVTGIVSRVLSVREV